MKSDKRKLYFIDGIAPSGDGETFVARLLRQEPGHFGGRFLYKRLLSEQVHSDLVEYYQGEGISERISGSENGLHDGMFLWLSDGLASQQMSFLKSDYEIKKYDIKPSPKYIKDGVRKNLEISEKGTPCNPRLYCFRVGQGDMSVFISSESRAYIIDTYIYSSCIEQKKALLKKVLGDRPVEALILTHRHFDHYLGAYHLFDWFKIKNLIVNNSFVQNEQPVQVERLLNKAHEEETKIITQSKSDSFNDGQTRFNFEIHNVLNASYNKNSIVLNITYKDKLYCLTGDADVRDLEKISYKPCNDIILKVSHHGSITGTSLPFLKNFDHYNNKKAFISVGQDNRYHHPNALCGFWLNGKNFDVTASTMIEDYEPY